MTVDVVKACRVKSHFELADHDPGSTFGWSKKAARAKLSDVLTDISGLQERLFAGKSAALLVVLQAIDAGGKDGTIREVFRSLNPAGIDVESFGVPSEEERSHDYLWRIHQRAPAKGRIGIFNRSHYEDVLVVRVKGFAPEHVWRRRFNHIRDFERMLCDEGTHVVKLYLNVSMEEQQQPAPSTIRPSDGSSGVAISTTVPCGPTTRRRSRRPLRNDRDPRHRGTWSRVITSGSATWSSPESCSTTWSRSIPSTRPPRKASRGSSSSSRGHFVQSSL